MGIGYISNIFSEGNSSPFKYAYFLIGLYTKNLAYIKIYSFTKKNVYFLVIFLHHVFILKKLTFSFIDDLSKVIKSISLIFSFQKMPVFETDLYLEFEIGSAPDFKDPHSIKCTPVNFNLATLCSCFFFLY